MEGRVLHLVSLTAVPVQEDDVRLQAHLGPLHRWKVVARSDVETAGKNNILASEGVDGLCWTIRRGFSWENAKHTIELETYITHPVQCCGGGFFWWNAGEFPVVFVETKHSILSKMLRYSKPYFWQQNKIFLMRHWDSSNLICDDITKYF